MQTSIFDKRYTADPLGDMENTFKHGSQCWRIVDLWRASRGTITNRQIVLELNIFNSTGRLSDCSKAGYHYEAQRINGGLWQFKLIDYPRKGQKAA